MAAKENPYEKFFNEADANGDGTLTLEELSAVLSKKGYRKDQIKVGFRIIPPKII